MIWKRGELIFQRGDPGDRAYIIDSGLVEIWRGDPEQPVRMALLGPGELFGELAVLGNISRVANATAVQDTHVTPINAAHLRRRVKDADPIVGLIVEMLIRHLRNADREEDESLAPQPRSPRAVQKMRLESALERALKTNALYLYYQPIVDLERGSVVGMEALVRWQHPSHGWVNPQSLVLLAEETDLIWALDRWVVARAASDLVFIREATDRPDLQVNVNLSAQEVGNTLFIDDIAEIVARHNLPTSGLKLEITENALVQATDASGWVRRCQTSGFQVVIDDFGTGYSSLAYLMDLAVDIVKIDQAFVRSLLNTPRAEPVIRAITQLAAALSMRVVVEGVEDQSTAERLAELGCQLGQGYYFSRPLSRPKLCSWLREQI